MEKSLINRAWIFLFFLSSVFLFSCKNVKNISKNQNYTEFNKIVANRVVSLSPSSTELLCLAGAKEKTKNLKKVSVYWEIWDSPLMSCGSLSNVNELIEIAGGKNIFSEINEAYPIVSEESLIYKNPEIIIFSKDFVGGVQKIKNRSGWKNISAVKNDKIFAVDSNTLTRPGSRIVENIETLLKIFHPEV